MTHDLPPQTPKRRLPLVRIAAVLVILGTAGFLMFQQKQRALVAVCEHHAGDPQEVLSACDTLLAGMVRLPETVSLIHRHKMRVYMRQQDWEAAETEADLAIAADPGSEVPWQWKSRILYGVDNYEGALVAIREALKRDPTNMLSLERRYKLLSKLERYDEIDELVSQQWVKGESVSWLPAASVPEVTWNPVQFPKSQAALLKHTEELRDDFASDLHNGKLRSKFILRCRLLAGNCPPLLPELRPSYPTPSCEQVSQDFEQQYLDFVKEILNDSGYQTWHELVLKDPLAATIEVQIKYIFIAPYFEKNPSQETSRRLILNHRMFECTSGGEIMVPDGFDEGAAAQLKQEGDTYFNRALRLNLLDLAYAYVD